MKRTHLLLIAMALIALSCGGAATTTTTAATTTTTSAAATTAPSTTAATTTTTPATTTTSGSTAGATVDVFVEDFSFSPSTVTIKVGDAVAWNLVGGSHTTTSGTSPTPDGMWNQTLNADTPTEVTFTEAGTFTYFCRFHPDFMTGTVVVEP